MPQASPILVNGIASAVVLIGLAALSFAFPYGVELQGAPLLPYIGLALLAGGVWALLPKLIHQTQANRRHILVIFAIGLLARGAMMVSTPVLEDDSYRYLWDGAVTAQGIDPYKYAPAEAATNGLFETPMAETAPDDLVRLRALAEAHPEPHQRVNFPYVSTIYPPLTQAAFAAAYMINPFGLTGWRLILLISDLAAFGLLLALLKAFGRSPLWAALYWWNPVVILQGFGAAHMDLLVVPFLLTTILLARKGQRNWSLIALSGAAAIKLWPILLAPLLLRPVLFQPVKLVASTTLFVAVTALLLAPQLVHALQPEAGLNAYSSDWRTHTFLFAIFEDVFFAGFDDPGRMARLFVAATISVMTLALAYQYGDRRDMLPALMTVVIASLIFLSPTGYPWYLIWLAPLLAFIPSPGLIALMVAAPLYWLRFYFGDASLFYQWGIVPIAFGLPLILILRPLIQKEPRHAIGHHHPGLE